MLITSNTLGVFVLSKHEMYGKYWLRMHHDFLECLCIYGVSSPQINNLSTEGYSYFLLKTLIYWTNSVCIHIFKDIAEKRLNSAEQYTRLGSSAADKLVQGLLGIKITPVNC